MTIAPLPPGTQTFYAPNGAVLVGGSLISSIPRTTVAKSLWGNPAQTGGVLANPLTLTTGQATLYGFGAYRQRVLDANGDTLSDSVTWGGQPNQTTIVLNSSDSGVFTVPNGIYSLYVEVVGAGGAGSNCQSNSARGDVSGGGGGAGGFASSLLSVTPGQTINYSVGLGGSTGMQNSGLASSFGSILANGGVGANFSGPGTSNGGVGGTASGGNLLNTTGGAGTDGSHIPPSGGAPYIGPGNGGASAYGQGGTAANDRDGDAGMIPGSGGGGAMDVNLTNVVYNGGAGADGQIIIQYWS